MESFVKAGKKVTEFSGILTNPTYGKVLEGAKLAKESKADLILGVGGGSVMDCCKAVSMAAVYDGDLWEDFWASATCSQAVKSLRTFWLICQVQK